MSLGGEEHDKMGLVSGEGKAEWRTLKHYLAKKNTGTYGISIT